MLAQRLYSHILTTHHQRSNIFPLIKIQFTHTPKKTFILVPTMTTSTTLTTIATTPTPKLTPTPTPAVQHVTKASSDELLSKFAELDSPKNKSLQLFKRRKKTVTSRRESLEGMVVVERKSLLPPVGTGRRSSGAGVLVKVGRAHFKGRSFRKRSIFGAIEKTWQRTIDGASKVFMEKQYNRHKRLLSDTT